MSAGPADSPCAAPAAPARIGVGAGLALFAAALIARVAYAWLATGPGAVPYSDPASYDALAWRIAQGLGFAGMGTDGVMHPTAVTPPLLPWMVAALYRVVGHDYFAAVLMQCVIGALAPLLAAAVGAVLFDAGVGLLAGWLCAVAPPMVFFNAYLLTENFLVTPLLLALWLAVSWTRSARAGPALAAGVCLGLANLARPTALFVPVLVAGWGWLALPPGLRPGRRAAQVALLLLGFAAALAPWTARNARLFGAFVPVATRGGGALWVGNNPGVWGNPAQRGGGAEVGFYESAEREFRGLGEVERDSLARSRAIAFLRAHADQWPAMAAAKLSRFWRVSAEGHGTGTWQRPGSPLAPLLHWLDPIRLWSLAVFPLALWGIACLPRAARPWPGTLPLWLILYFSALAVVFWGSLRMRLPAEPVIALLAAFGAMDLTRRVRRGARAAP